MDVTFRFKIDQKVVTPFDDVGIVSACTVDDNNALQYYVKRSTESQYFKEDQLMASD